LPGAASRIVEDQLPELAATSSFGPLPITKTPTQVVTADG